MLGYDLLMLQQLLTSTVLLKYVYSFISVGDIPRSGQLILRRISLSLPDFQIPGEVWRAFK